MLKLFTFLKEIKLKFNYIYKCLFATVTAFFIAGSLIAADFTFKYGHGQGPENPRSQSMDFFKKELEKLTKGRIAVQNFYSGQLGNEREMMDLVATGALQGTRGGKFADANILYNIASLPFLTEGWDEMICLVNSDFMENINKGAATKGYHIPATGISQGFRAHTNSVRPITRPADLKGLRMRVPGQIVYIVTAKAMGANPIEMPFSEFYQSMQLGVVDGQDNPPANIWDHKAHEVQKYMSITNYSTTVDPLIVSLKWYNTLPADLKKTFDEVSKATIAMSDKLNRDLEQSYIDKLAKHVKINYVTGQGLKEFQEASNAVYEHFVKEGDFTWDHVKAAKAAAKSCM